MSKSTITIRYQTTVPKEVREKLGVKPSDTLQWEVLGDHALVTAEPAESTAGKVRKVPPGAGAFDSGHVDTADRVGRSAREAIYSSGLVGCAEAEADLSETYKSRLREGLGRKHGHR